jgi:hypothetical protein
MKPLVIAVGLLSFISNASGSEIHACTKLLAPGPIQVISSGRDADKLPAA